MNFKDKIENLSKDIQDINNLLEIIKNNNGISRIEVDILKARIQGLYLSLLELDNKEPDTQSGTPGKDLSDFERNFEVIEALVPEPEAETKPEQPVPENIPVSEEKKPVKKPAREDTPETLVNNISKEEEEIIPEPVTKSEPESIKEQEPKVEIPQEPEIKHKKLIQKKEILNKEKESMPSITNQHSDTASKEVVSDMYKDKQKYRNESLQKDKMQHDISAQFHNQPIASIASAIGINDKFRYIRELFSGNSDMYSKTIEFLNTVDSEQKAATYLKDKCSLDTENKLVKQLLDLTRRKLKTKADG